MRTANACARGCAVAMATCSILSACTGRSSVGSDTRPDRAPLQALHRCMPSCRCPAARRLRKDCRSRCTRGPVRRGGCKAFQSPTPHPSYRRRRLPSCCRCLSLNPSCSRRSNRSYCRCPHSTQSCPRHRRTCSSVRRIAASPACHRGTCKNSSIQPCSRSALMDCYCSRRPSRTLPRRCPPTWSRRWPARTTCPWWNPRPATSVLSVMSLPTRRKSGRRSTEPLPDPRGISGDLDLTVSECGSFNDPPSLHPWNKRGSIFSRRRP
jgi:hypothetical protein